MSFGSRIKDLRKKFNLSQVDLGKGIGVSGTTISQYESNLRFPNQKTLVKLCRYMHVSSDYLLGLSEKKATSSDADKIVIDCKGFSREQLDALELLMRAFSIKRT